MMISRLEALFWLQFFLVVIGVSHQLTVNFLLVPLFIGLLLFANLVLKRLFVIDRVFIFFSVLFVGYFVRCVLAETFMQINFVQESSMIISGYALVNAFQNLKFSIFSTRLAYSLILITTLYFIATYAIGIPALESVSYIFLSGSYHIVTWLCLLTIGLYEVFSRKPRLTIYVVFFVMSLLLGGRSGIVISFLLLSVKFLLNNKRSGKSALLVSKWFLFLLITFFIWDYELYKVGDLLSRFFLLGPREFIWLCYFDNLTFKTFVFGFDVNSLEPCIAPHLTRNSLESSLISLNYNTGALAVPLIYMLIRELARLWRVHRMVFFIALCLLFRITTGEFVFITIFDWLFLLIFFSHSRSYYSNQQRK